MQYKFSGAAQQLRLIIEGHLFYNQVFRTDDTASIQTTVSSTEACTQIAPAPDLCIQTFGGVFFLSIKLHSLLGI